MANIHISISAEPIFSLGGIEITNSMLVSWAVTLGLCLFAVLASRKLHPTNKPKGMQNFLEVIIESLYNMVAGVMGERKSKQVLPYIATFFIFILLGNWAGLLPGVGTIGFKKTHPVAAEKHVEETTPATAGNEHATEETVAQPATTVATAKPTSKAETEFVPLLRGATADINVTLGLALTSVFLIQYVGLKNLGLSYFGKFFNFKSPITIFIGLLELIAEFAKILSFAFRLFGNIFAGEVLLVVMAAIAPMVLFFVPIPFLGLELFVGIVQALVFSMLTLVFMQIATISHAEEHS